MSKDTKYLVIDWGSWGLEVQSSLKIIVKDPDIKEGDECSLQGKDPATKRAMLFHGKVLAVFGNISLFTQWFSMINIIYVCSATTAIQIGYFFCDQDHCYLEVKGTLSLIFTITLKAKRHILINGEPKILVELL